MFENSDFEFDDDTVTAIFDSVSNKHVTSFQKRHSHDEINPSECGKKIKIDPILKCESKVRDPCFSLFNDSPEVHVETNSCYDSNSHKNEYISIKNSSVKKPSQRKFPGPAGLLPIKVNLQDQNDVVKSTQNVEEPCFMSQECDKVFGNSAWNKMLEDFNYNKINGQILTDKYNIKWLKKSAVDQKLINQKAPFLAALIQKIERPSVKSPGITLTLKDESGEIKGTIINDLFEEYVKELKIGSVVVLKQFGVLPTCSSHVITITENNLVRIYYEINKKEESFDKSGLFEDRMDVSDVFATAEIVNVQKITVESIIENIEQIRKHYKQNQISDDVLDVYLNDFSKNFEEKLLNLEKGQNLIKTIGSEKRISNNSSSSLLNKNCSNSPVIPLNNTRKMKFEFKKKSINKEYDDVIFSGSKSNSVKLGNGNSSQISVMTDNLEEKKIVENILEGLDAESFFEDF